MVLFVYAGFYSFTLFSGGTFESTQMRLAAGHICDASHDLANMNGADCWGLVNNRTWPDWGIFGIGQRKGMFWHNKKKMMRGGGNVWLKEINKSFDFYLTRHKMLNVKSI